MVRQTVLAYLRGVDGDALRDGCLPLALCDQHLEVSVCQLAARDRLHLLLRQLDRAAWNTER